MPPDVLFTSFNAVVLAAAFEIVVVVLVVDVVAGFCWLKV